MADHFDKVSHFVFGENCYGFGMAGKLLTVLFVRALAPWNKKYTRQGEWLLDSDISTMHAVDAWNLSQVHIYEVLSSSISGYCIGRVASGQ